MRIYDNGIYRDMTPEEIEECNKLQSELPPLTPTQEERLEALEAALLEVTLHG